MVDRSELLRVPAFADLPEDQIDWFLSNVEELHLKEGNASFRQGDPADAMFVILEGQIRYRIGSLPVFLADQGDIVYVPKQTWHLASHGPTEMSTRLAMNGYQDLLHNFEPTEEQTTRR